ncbi:uncharacterized protein EV420DRAFT_1076857 [Desarmillaria tabescens]|uniref:Uncharacterized protein n=1 Tax=Armillaria tabescens TaxID=1929756 RepID=A0AA39MQW5_ARMTA|nr:uncharacterized protein EV420DRAFT_1076857 [Desarmillaria tabescens]KAK0442505.1 hypothetical protein EV420DRAFT_1076857 [Desarmillaria tabescens]
MAKLMSFHCDFRPCLKMTMVTSHHRLRHFPPLGCVHSFSPRPTTASRLSLFPMPPLSPLPPTPTPTQDPFTHPVATLLPNLTTLHAPPHLIILLAPSRPLIDVSITISTPIYAGFVLHPLSNLSLPPFAVSTLSSSPSVNAKKKRISEARSSHTPTLRNSRSKERAARRIGVASFPTLSLSGYWLCVNWGSHK